MAEAASSVPDGRKLASLAGKEQPAGAGASRAPAGPHEQRAVLPGVLVTPVGPTERS